MRRWLDALGEACRQRRAAVLAVALLSCLLCGVVIWAYWGRVARVSDWFPPGPEQRAFLRGQREFVVAQDLMVLVSGTDGLARERFLQQFTERLQERRDLFVDVLFQVELAPLRSGLLYYLTVAQLQGLETALISVRPLLSREQSLAAWVTLLQGEQTSGLGARLGAHYLKQLATCLRTAGRTRPASPLGQLLQTEQAQLIAPFWDKRESVYLPIDEGRRLLCFARPGEDPGESLAYLRSSLAEIGPRNPGVRAELTGMQVIAQEQRASLEASLGQAVFISLSLVLLALWFNIVPPGRLLVGMLAWGVGLAWTAGLGALWLSSTGPLWMGGLALVATISGFLTLQTVWLAHLRLNLTVSVAGSVALAALGFSGNPALTNVGQMAALGLLASALSLMTVLPALEGAAATATAAPDSIWRSVPLIPDLHRAGAVLVTTGVVAAGCLLWLGSLSFEADPWALVDRRVPSLQMEMELSGTRTSSLYATLMAPDLPSARALAARLQQLPTVDKVFSIAQYMPADVELKRPLVERICELSRGAEVPQAVPLATAQDMLALQAHVGEGSAGTGLLGAVDLERMGPGELQDALRSFQEGILGDLTRLVDLLAAQRARPPQLEDLPRDIRERTVGTSGRICLMVFPRFPYGPAAFLEGSVYEGFVEQLRHLDTEVSGPAAFVALASAMSRQAHYWALGLAWTGLLVGLTIQLRSLRRALMVMFGPSLAWLLTAALLFARGVTPNLINWPVPIIHLILGAAFALDSLRRPRLSRRVLGPTVVVLGAALALAATPHPALASLGYSLGLSLACNLLVAFGVMPALQRLLQALGRVLT